MHKQKVNYCLIIKYPLNMANLEKYNKAFVESFNVAEQILPELKYQSIAAWDSVGHMALMAVLEEAFNIMMETDDIIEFSSYNKGQEILKKYGVEM